MDDYNCCNRIQIHYLFDDDSHTINANVFNKTEYEVLGLIKEITTKLKLDVEIETEPIENGSIKSWLKLKTNNKNATIADAIKISVVTYLLTTVLGTPITTSFEYLTQKALDHVFESKEVRELVEKKRIEELKLDIAKIQQETQRLTATIDENVVKKRTSNFYQTIEPYKKVNQVSFCTAKKDKSIIDIYDVQRQSFSSFILKSDDLDPEIDEHAVIEIISPVLKKGKYKWTGYYNEKIISFSMLSDEFKTDVQSGNIGFKNGFSIDCQLEICKKLDEDGNAIPNKHNVLLVNSYFENSEPIETVEGKRFRQRKEANEKQLKLF